MFVWEEEGFWDWMAEESFWEWMGGGGLPDILVGPVDAYLVAPPKCEG